MGCNRFLLFVLSIVCLFDFNEALTEQIIERAKRVIGGQLANEGEFPYLASINAKVATKKLLFFTSQSTEFYCGAALIDQRWLLTAAHCIFPTTAKGSYDLRDGKYWNVRLSAVKLKPSLTQKMKHWMGKIIGKKSWWQWEFKVDSIYTHPQYQSSDIANDIALIKLKDAVPYWESNKMGLVSLPPSNVSNNWPTVGTSCRFVGWGCQEKGGSVSREAYKVPLPIIDDNACYRVFSQKYIQQDDVCAGYFNEGKSICQGDSGGGLVCDFEGRPVVAGVASAVHGDRPAQYPAIFTRVSSHLAWIKTTMLK